MICILTSITFFPYFEIIIDFQIYKLCGTETEVMFHFLFKFNIIKINNNLAIYIVQLKLAKNDVCSLCALSTEDIAHLLTDCTVSKLMLDCKLDH